MRLRALAIPVATIACVIVGFGSAKGSDAGPQDQPRQGVVSVNHGR